MKSVFLIRCQPLSAFHHSRLLPDKRHQLSKGFGRLGEEGGQQGEAVDHVGPDFDIHIHPGPAGFFGEAGRVVQQDLIRADLDEERRQAVQVRVERRDPGFIQRVLAGVVAVPNRPRAFGGDIGPGPGFVRLARAFQIGPGRERRARRGDGAAPRSRMATRVARHSPPPADSPTTMIFSPGMPCASSPR